MALGKCDGGTAVVPKGSHKDMDGFPHRQPAAVPGADKSSSCAFSRRYVCSTSRLARLSQLMPFLSETVKMAVADSGSRFMSLPEQNETLLCPCRGAQHPSCILLTLVRGSNTGESVPWRPQLNVGRTVFPHQASERRRPTQNSTSASAVGPRHFRYVKPQTHRGS